ncbi:hypothetical protein BVX97_03685 [bacterium E08(2017)]|nr:hypothetical protein BVX97_03685 [bacterium E08(2017)]
MDPSTAVLIVIAAGMLLAATLTVYSSIRRQNNEELRRLAAENKVLRQENYDFVNKEHRSLDKVEWYRAVLANTEDMVFVYSLDEDMTPTTFIEVNNVACDRLMYKRSELLNMKPMNIGYDESTASVLGLSTSDMVMMTPTAEKEKQKKISLRPIQNLMKRIVDEKEAVFERRYVTRDKTEFPVEIRARSIRMDGKYYIISTAHDITYRKETQEALQESEQRFRSFFEHSPIGVAMYDANKTLVNVNVAFIRMLGIPDREQFKRFDVFNFPYIPEQVREKVRTGESVRLNIDVNFDEIRQKSMFITTRTGNGHLDLMINNMGRDRNRRSRGFLVQLQDNTQSFEAENSLRQSEKQLRQAEKMEAIGSMAGGIAHDFNNILTPILGYTELALRTCEDDERMEKFMSEIMKASHRAKDLVNQILTFSRQKDKDGQPIRLIPIIKEVINLMRASMPESIEIKRIIRTEYDIVLADPTQMHQVLMNLCTNAWHAMKEMEEGVLEIRAVDFIHEKGSKGNLSEMESGRYLQVSVCDTGVGMTEEIIERIFDPFFTTKKTGEGTGMGLSVVRNIVTSFKGKIVVDSKVGTGSEFHIMLPVIEDETMDKMKMSSQPLRTGSETVLLVDDDPSILEMVARMLETLGYKTMTAKLGEEALEIFKKNTESIDVILTDQVMPGMLGNELAAEVFAVKPDVPVILCTGFSESFAMEQAQAAGVRAFLKKPIIMRDLADAVRDCLDPKAS